MNMLLCLCLTLTTLQSDQEPLVKLSERAADLPPSYSDGELAEIAYESIVSDLRAQDLSAEQMGFAVNRRPDTAVARDVDTLLMRSLRPLPVGLNVSCYRGNVLLRGVVATKAGRDNATELAAHVPGVRAVLNRMMTPTQSQPGGPIAEIPNELPSQRGPFAFLTQDGLAGNNVSLDVIDGQVFVKGYASSEKSRAYVTASIGRIPGTRMVQNNMTTRPNSPQEDERLARLVQKKMSWEQKLHGVSKNFRLSVRHGILTISGQVETEEQATLARVLAADTTGIIVVDDQIVVAAGAR
ncbi:MAG: BON domain-containing protein [Planctomycetota bacterium]|nr:BON domain-containing protein [Planctomycetota bacterium]